MSLATRCNACGTVFRVVQDQLKVSEGWVRCGRCNEVFNALEGLYDLDREEAQSWGPTVPDPGQFGSETDAPIAPALAADVPADWHATPEAPTGPEIADEPALSHAFVDDGGAEAPADPALVDRIDEQIFGPRPSDTHHRPLADLDDRDRLDFADARLDSDLTSDSPMIDLDLDPTPPPGLDIAAADASDAPPEFVQRAERAARWRRPGVRIALGATSLVLLVALGLQVMHHRRDWVAVRFPEARGAIEAWCDWLTCRIEPLRRIEDLTVESSALTRAPGTTDTFRLAVALRNHGELALAMPSIDLSLTDASGQLVARRALNPSDFHIAESTIGAGAESSLQLSLAAADPRVSGYTVEIFYP